MLLATRCPFCETVFRLEPQQLAARRGLVRCGHCQEAFDATGSLFEVPAGGDIASAVPIPADVAATLISPSTPLQSQTQSVTGTSATDTPVKANPPDFANRGWDAWAARADGPADSTRSDVGEHPAPSPTPGAARPFPAPPAEPHLAPNGAASVSADAASKPWTRVDSGPVEPTLSARPIPASAHDQSEPHLSSQLGGGSVPPGGTGGAGDTFAPLPPADGGGHFTMTREPPAGARRRTGWRIFGVLAALVLLALLAMQVAWWLRESVMVYWPASQPLYLEACEKIGCRVMPPRDIDGLQVEPSDLRQVDDPHHLELKMPLRNRFNVALAYPAIELTLLDRQNNVVIRRVLWPQDYVPPGTRIDAGLPARTAQTMIVRLDTGNVVASNFRVEIFYP